jgi:hypothetical protein
MIHVAEVKHLLTISQQQTRLRDAEVINRAAVVFLMAVWQTYVEALADETLAETLSHPPSTPTPPTRISTPSAERIDALFERLLGVSALSRSWRWRGMTTDRARRKLRQILALRHQIAHKARTKTRVRRSTVLEYVHFVHRLAVCQYNAIATHLAKRTGRAVRPRLRYRGTVGELS